VRNLTVITAEILPGKYDPSAEAYFFNVSRAAQYASCRRSRGRRPTPLAEQVDLAQAMRLLR
jgi:hypothetical protein